MTWSCCKLTFESLSGDYPIGDRQCGTGQQQVLENVQSLCFIDSKVVIAWLYYAIVCLE